MKFKKVLLILFATLFLVACNNNNNQTTIDEGETIVENSGEVDQLEEEKYVKYTELFDVEFLDDGVKLVRDAEDQEFILVPRGQDVPEGYEDHILIYTPVENALFASTASVGQLAPFDVYDSIKGVTYDSKTWKLDEINERLESGEIEFVGRPSDPDFEAIQSLSPDISVVYTGTSPQTELIGKLDELGFPYVVVNSSQENSPEGRMEWVKLLAAFFNKDEEAKEYFDNQIDFVEKVKEKVAEGEKPKVVWGIFSKDQMFVPAADSYEAAMVREAGGDYIFDVPGVSNARISIEEFFLVLKEADVWIYPSTVEYTPDYQALFDKIPVAEDTKVVQDRDVWQTSIYYMQHISNAHIQVEDLAAIIHPDLYEGYEITYFNKLAE